MSVPNPCRIVLAGGGTGGHLFPAVAIADRLFELLAETVDLEITFIGTKHGLEYRLKDSLGYPLELIGIRGLARTFSLRNLLLPFTVTRALFQAARLIRRLQPHVVVGTGGYVSWPVLRMAAGRGVATVVQEQNSFPGIATRQCAQQARKVYLGFERAQEYIKSSGDIIVSGNPVRKTVRAGDRARALAEFDLDPARKTILVLGGSQGARSVNQAVLRSLKSKAVPDGYQILWQVGKRDYTDVTAEAGNRVPACSLFPFSQKMDLVYAAADLAVARAGALTIAELSACGLPALLIPYPHAAGDHQRKNAEAVAAMGHARVLDNAALGTTDLIEEAVRLLQSDDYTAMKDRIDQYNRGHRPAVDVIAEGVIELLNEAD